MRTAPAQTARRGSISLIVLIALPVLLLFVALALFASQRKEARTELQGCADAASLAAALCLVDDCRLLGDERAIHELVARCRKEAQRYAHNNPVFGRPQELHENHDNDPQEDIVVGRQLHSRGERFMPAHVDSSTELFALNAVRIHARRTRERGTPLPFVRGPFLSQIPTDMTVGSTAVLDQFVLGLRPINTIPLPCAPIGLLSDPSGEAKRSWEHQVERRLGVFELPTMEVRFGLKKGNACLLQIGTRSADELARQLVEGVSREQLAPFGGELIFDREGQFRLPGTLVGPERYGVTEQELILALQHLIETRDRRIFPLYRAIDPETGHLVCTGFVTARVIDVKRMTKREHDRRKNGKDDDKHENGNDKDGKHDKHENHDGKDDQLRHDEDEGELVITLQPTMMACAAVVTTTDRPSERLEPPPNRYLCKVRLAP